MNDIELGIL